MKISTKGRYALRMLVDLAEHKEKGYIALKDIAQRQEISKKYLEQIVPMLHNAGILRTNRGFQGGYALAVSPDKLTVGDILRITEGSLAPVACLDMEPAGCERGAFCPVLPMWKGLEKVINDYLDGVTGYRAVETARGRFLVSRISRSVKEVAKRLAEEFAQSGFEPIACELKIGGEGENLEFPYDGGKISVSGSIDRVDKFGGYIRVVDYKTGKTKDILKTALKEFDGTLIVVSHDREFLDGLVTKVYEFGGGVVKEHIGGIYDFLQKKQIENLNDLQKSPSLSSSPAVGKTVAGSNAGAAASQTSAAKLSYEEQKELNKKLKKLERRVADCEAEIERTESAISILEAKMATPEGASDMALYEQHQKLKAQLDNVMEEWDAASSELEEARK